MSSALALEPARASPAAPPAQAVRETIEIGRTDDPAEHEAERVANRLHRFASGSAVGPAPPIVHEVLATAGRPLSAASRAHFEPRLGIDLGAVRVHDDRRAAESARAVEARAYTVGDHVAFGAGELDGVDGQRLLAHELAHVAQRRVSHLRRYQAGEMGHGAIEADALHAAGFGGDMTHGEIGAVYLGNWMRDWSQIGDPHTTAILTILNVLSMGEFNRPVTAEQVGGYLASEHLDRPVGGGSVEDPRATAAVAATARAAMSTSQQSFEALEHDADFQRMIGERVRASELPPYIEVGKARARAELQAAARGRRGDPESMRRMGGALHAIEDYYSHSNFVDSCVYLLVQEGRLPASSRVFRGIVGRARAFGYDPSGGLVHGRRLQIMTGAYRSTGNKTVSLLEQLSSEVETGALRRAAVLGAIRVGMVNAGAIGRRAGSTAGQYVVGGLAAVGGTTVEGARGLASGAARGWSSGHGLGAVVGAAREAVAGTASGVEAGARGGWREGGAAGAELGGRGGEAVGEVVGAGIEAVAIGAVVALISAALEVARRHEADREALSDHETRQATRADRAAGDPLPNHSQLAKDDIQHPLFGVSRSLAVYADTEIGRAMILAWAAPGDEARVNDVMALVDRFVSHPLHNDWWREPLLAAIARSR